MDALKDKTVLLFNQSNYSRFLSYFKRYIIAEIESEGS